MVVDTSLLATAISSLVLAFVGWLAISMVQTREAIKVLEAQHVNYLRELDQLNKKLDQICDE